MQSTSKKVLLGRGTIDFADPKSPWTPNLTTLPSTALSLGFAGTLQTCDFSTINLTNCRTYSDYEPNSIKNSLSKSFLIDSAGSISYAEPVLGVASTLTIFGPENRFAPSTIGGANIQDTLQNVNNPDTVTTALAKLDGWITGAFLLQPPIVTITSSLTTNVYGGLQWSNPRRYPFLNEEIPYITGINLIVGNGTTNSLNLVIANSKYFPYLNYSTGILSDSNHTPLSEVRIYSRSFPISADIFYTGSQLSTNGFYISSATGTFIPPTSGNIMAITSTNGVTTRTTMSLYLPNITGTYPNGTQIPFQITLQNASLGQKNTATSSIAQLVQGAPSAPRGAVGIPLATTTLTASLSISSPQYSDSTNLDTSPANFSTYITSYSISQLANSHTSGVGFRYGVPNVTTLTQSPYDSLVGNIYRQNDAYSTEVQSITIAPGVPAVVWNASTRMTNVFAQQGPPSNGVFLSTIFQSNTAPSISTIRPVNTTTSLTRTANDPGVQLLQYNASGWSIQSPLAYDVFYLSNNDGNDTPLTFTTSSVQFNHTSFPGDRSTISYTVVYSNTDATTPSTLELAISSINNDFSLIQYTKFGNPIDLYVYLTDVFSNNTANSNFYYQASSIGYLVPEVNISTSAGGAPFPNSLYIVQSNRQITSYNGAITSNLQSSLTYNFYCQPYLFPPTQPALTYNNVCCNATQVSGLYTPDCNATFYYDFTTNEIGYLFVGSNLGQGTLTLGNTIAGPTTTYTSNIIICNDLDGTLLSNLPFSRDILLRFSTVSAVINATQYTPPGTTNALVISTVVTGHNPSGVIRASSNLTIQTGGSNVYIDTYSAAGARNFSNISTINGLRITTNLPVPGQGWSVSNIGDSVDSNGMAGGGLSTLYNATLISMTAGSVGFVSSVLYYQHTSSLSTSYSDYYSRELQFASNTYIHPAGTNYSGFNATPLGITGYGYPDFTNDLSWDCNFGYRYATFAYQSNCSNTRQQFLYVTVNAPSALGGIQSLDRDSNSFWPNSLVVAPVLMSSMKVRLHAQLYYSFTSGTLQSNTTQWVNGFKPSPPFGFNDSVFDTGGGIAVSTLNAGTAVQYKIQFNSRIYNNIIALVRVGIAKDASISNASPITFQSINIAFSNV